MAKSKITWKIPKDIEEILNSYYKSKYNMTYEEFIAEYGAADFAHDESLVVHTIKYVKDYLKEKMNN